MTISSYRVLVTGSSGFIGRNLISLLDANGVDVVETTRNARTLGDRKIFLDLSSDEPICFSGFETVIHLAAIAHNKHEIDTDFNEINFKATERLAVACVNAGVKRLIYLSSIGVNGTCNEAAFKETDKPAPESEYAMSKFNAEVAIKRVCESRSMSYVVIRPPLVYGPNAPGNIEWLVKAMQMFIPMPFGGIQNCRHFCHIDNLTSFVCECTAARENERINNQVFLVSDDRPMTTSQFVRTIGVMHKKRPLLIRFPVRAFRTILSIISQRLADSLLSDLRVSNEKAKTLTKWRPVC